MYCILLPYYSSLVGLFCSHIVKFMVKWRISGLNSWLTCQCPKRRWAKDRLKVSEESLLEYHRAVEAEKPSCTIIATNHTFFLVLFFASMQCCLYCALTWLHEKFLTFFEWKDSYSRVVFKWSFGIACLSSRLWEFEPVFLQLKLQRFSWNSLAYTAFILLSGYQPTSFR